MVVANHNLFKTKTGLNECRWLAVNNPNYITLVRQDYQVSLIQTSGVLFTNVVINTTGISQAQFQTDFAVGSQIYLSAIDRVVTVSTRTYISNNSIVRFIYDGISYNTGGGYANCFSRANYFIEVKYINFINTGTFPIRTEKVIPLRNGELMLNISPSCKSFFNLKTDNEDLSIINIRDANVSGIVGINYREYYRTTYQPETLLLNQFVCVNNYKNALEEFGSCLAEYEMQLLSDNKFVTRMVKPYYWDGYPFALGFLFPISLVDKFVQKLEIEQDINEQTIQSAFYTIEKFNPAANFQYLNSLTLNGGYSGESVLVRLVANVTSGGNIFSYADGYAKTGYFSGFAILPQLTLQIISEFKRVYVGKCADNPVYLRWRNSLGYFDHWLFTKRQVKNTNVDKFDTFNTFITDIEFQQERETVQSKDKNKVWRLGAYLEMQSVTDINELFSSPFVQWFNEENQQWYSVKVKSGTYLSEITSDEYAEIEFEIEFPNEYKQEQ
jgi:hypothetical protein